MIAGRVKALEGGLGWQALDQYGNLLAENNITDRDISETWRRQSEYVSAHSDCDALRVQLNVTRQSGTVAFDDLILVQFNEPLSTTATHTEKH